MAPRIRSGRERVRIGWGWLVSELAALRIYRPPRLWGLGAAMIIEMDGRELTRLPSGGDWVGYVEAGRHILQVRAWPYRPLLELMLAPGDDVRVEARISGWGGPVLVRTDGVTTGPHVHPSAPPPDVQVLGITETHRSEEPIGAETRRVDNTSGVGRVTRTIRVTEEWSRMVSLDLDVRQSVSVGAQIGPNRLALKTSIEQSLERTYAISVSRREEFAEEIGVEIEPGADVTVLLTWKRIWQHGTAHVMTEGRQAKLPFRMAVGVTFDQGIK